MSNVTRRFPPFRIGDVIAHAACPQCDHGEVHIIATDTIHAAGKRCWECGEHRGWMKKAVMAC